MPGQGKQFCSILHCQMTPHRDWGDLSPYNDGCGFIADFIVVLCLFLSFDKLPRNIVSNYMSWTQKRFRTMLLCLVNEVEVDSQFVLIFTPLVIYWIIWVSHLISVYLTGESICLLPCSFQRLRTTAKALCLPLKSYLLKAKGIKVAS